MPKFSPGIYLVALLIMLISVTGYANAQDRPAPERIVVLFPQSFGLFFVLNAVDSIVALPARLMGVSGELQGFYGEIAPELANAADIGQPVSPNLETILQAKPDLIVASLATEHASVVDKLFGEKGVRVLQLHAGFGSIADWLSAVDDLAAVLGKSDQAKKYRAFFEARLELVRSRLADVPPSQRPKVALLNTQGSQMVIRGSRTVFGFELISMAGGQLMQQGDASPDSAACAELMFSFDPDLIIDDSKVDVFYRASWWNSLRAVKGKKVFKTPADDSQAWVTNWCLPAYSPLGLLWLAKKIHPEKFADIDLRKEHADFCRMLYGREFNHSGPGFQ